MVHFVPPEFAVDQLSDVVGEHFTGASDVYSLAASVYFLLTGKGPTRTMEAKQAGAGYRELLEIVREGEIVPLCERETALPPALGDLLMQSLRKVPGERPTAEEFRDCLRLIRAEL